MRRRSAARILAVVFSCLAVPSTLLHASDPAQAFKTNCVLCHASNGSGDSPVGKSMHARDLRSAEVQSQSDTALAEIIAKGKGKMPAFGKKMPPADLNSMAAYVRTFAAKP
jgi:cytochrome c6